MTESGDAIHQRYQELVARYASRYAQLRQHDWAFGIARLAAFLLILLVILLAVAQSIPWWPLVFPVIVFIAIAVWHEQIIGRMEETQLLRQIHERQIARRERRWKDLPVPELVVPAERQCVARDLDVVGPRSLFQWLSVAHTPMGKNTLRDWLMYPAPPQVVIARQSFVRALANEFEWREQLQLHGAQLGPLPLDSRHFIDWATGPQWLASRSWLAWTARLSVAMLLLTGVAMMLQLIAFAVGAALLLALLVLNIAICIWYTGKIHDIFDAVSGHADQVRHYRAMLNVAARLPQSVGRMEIQNADLREVAQSGLARLSSLHTIVRFLNSRRDTFLGILYLLGQLTCLIHVHLLSWLEVWQRRWGREAPAWFEALGQLEALASLATAAYDQPDWTYPRVDPAAQTCRAVALGHPLLTGASRVSNDMEVGPPGTFLLVTGSNMSGKSTLLRSLGVNVLLAQAGGVVCAQEMILPPLDVETSMRISDSLADGVSFFLAELRRLKDIVEHARRTRREGRQLLYLLDEILQGTNSRERQLAVIRVIHHLLEQGAIGAVTTHDLELASSAALRERCRVVHFRESFTRVGEKQTMTFDYKLQPGVAPTTNALVLLEMVGLGEKPNEAASEDH